jgi:uncharacterized Fe-S cluster-containing MiaB family protein
MQRYSKITNVHKYKREIVLLKSRPCAYSKCTFCDYILDNSKNIPEIDAINANVLKNITGEFGILQVINSGNVFELPSKTKKQIKQIIKDKDIKQLFIESHWMYRKHLYKLNKMFDVDVFVMGGLESFDESYREGILNKGFHYESIDELRKYFDSVHLMIGAQGQTKDIIKSDIAIAKKYFDHTTINMYVNNTTVIKADDDLKKWFLEEYKYLHDDDQFEILTENTDLGVG